MEERRRHDLPAAFSRTFPTDGNWKVILAGPTSSATCRPFPRRVPTPGPVGALAGPAARRSAPVATPSDSYFPGTFAACVTPDTGVAIRRRGR